MLLRLSFIFGVFAVAGTCVYAADYAVYVVEPAVNNHVILRDAPLPPVCKKAEKIQLWACPGEHEPASIVITANKRLENLRIEVGELAGPGGNWSQNAVDVRVVKEFYRGTPWGAMVLPTLLVHDENFLELEPDPTSEQPNRMKNVLRGELRDAVELQPVMVEGNKQFWITVHVPEHAKAGTYQATIRIVPGNSKSAEMSLQVEVYPFRLEPPMLEYSIYYPTQLLLPGEEPSGFQQIPEEQYRRELENMVAHGLTNPNIYWALERREDGSLDFSRLEQVLALRESVGIRPRALYLVSHPILFTDRPLTQEERQRTYQYVQEINAWARARGYSGVFFMAQDEWWGERLSRERDSMAAVHEAGGQIFVAVMQPPFFNQVGDVLDRPILQSNLTFYIQEAVKQYRPEEAVHHLEKIARVASFQRMSSNKRFRKAIDGVHRLGNKIFTYMNPPGGLPLPGLQRRSEGLGLWRLGFDGTMTWAYIHYHTSKIDLLDQGVNWALVFRIPDGVLDTLHWEGFGEGVDDVRYLTTLLATLNQVVGRFPDDPFVTQTMQWVKQLDVAQGDLDALRREMAQRTIALLDLGAREVPPQELLANVNLEQVKVVAFPEPWRFQIDRVDQGQKEKWFNPALDDKPWATVRTDQNLGWDKQGFENQAEGLGWYRAALPLTRQDLTKKFRYLHFGAVDEDAWVYLNGRKIFEHTVESTGMLYSELWLIPFVVPLSDIELHGGDLLAVRVLNRTGMGGIWKPVHVVLSDQEMSNEQVQALMKLHQTEGR